MLYSSMDAQNASGLRLASNNSNSPSSVLLLTEFPQIAVDTLERKQQTSQTWYVLLFPVLFTRTGNSYSQVAKRSGCYTPARATCSSKVICSDREWNTSPTADDTLQIGTSWANLKITLQLWRLEQEQSWVRVDKSVLEQVSDPFKIVILTHFVVLVQVTRASWQKIYIIVKLSA